MKKSFYASAAALALSAGTGSAQADLAFTPSEGPFNWDSYNALSLIHI